MKKILVLLLTTLTALTFAACSTKADNQPTDTGKATNAHSNNAVTVATDTKGSSSPRTETKTEENMLESIIPDVSTNVNTEGQP